MSSPRPALLPERTDQVDTGPCVCLSPAVLDGDEYACTDDIYAFGLLLWEMLFPDECKPFEEQRKWTLSKFIEKCHPRDMLAESLDKLPASKEVMAVLRGTLLVNRKQNRGQALTIPAIQRLLNQHFYPSNPSLHRRLASVHFEEVDEDSDIATLETLGSNNIFV